MNIVNLCSNIFTEVLEKVPADDWYRNWPADRTIMLSKTSKKIKNIINKMRIPVHVQWDWKFFNDSQNGTAEVKLNFIMMQLNKITSLYLYKITSLVLSRCNIQINIEQLVKVLEQCPMLQKLNLKGNNITTEGVAKIIKVIEQYNLEINYIDLSINKIGDIGAEKVAELLFNNKCSKLLYLNLSLNKIGDMGTEKLALAIGQYPNLMLIELDLSHNLIRADGVDSLITQCSKIKRLDLSWNYIGIVEAASLAKRHNIDISTLFQMRTVSYP